MEQETRILVVGGTGFIGRYVVNHALKLGWDVTCLSLNPNVDNDLPNLHFVSADLANYSEIEKALSNKYFDYVANCGGYIDHTPFFKGGAKTFDSHFRGVVNLIECIDRDRLKCFVNIGSSDEYGNVPAPQRELFREAPISPYSLAKVSATHFLQMLCRTEGVPSVTLRLFLTYGPGQNDQRFLPQIIRGCLEARSFPTSFGEQLRDFCFVGDTVDAIFQAFECDQAKGEVFNIGSGHPVSIRKIIETVRDLVGSGNPKFGEIAYRPGENMELFADISKAKTVLEWEPKISLEQGLKMTIEWIRNQ